MNRFSRSFESVFNLDEIYRNKPLVNSKWDSIFQAFSFPFSGVVHVPLDDESNHSFETVELNKNTQILCFAEKKTVKLFDIKKYALHQFEVHKISASNNLKNTDFAALKISVCRWFNDRILLAAFTSHFCNFDIELEKTTRQINYSSKSTCTSIAVQNKSHSVFVGTSNGKFETHDLRQKESKLSEWKSVFGGPIKVFCDESNLVGLTNIGGKIEIIDTRTGKSLSLVETKHRINRCQFYLGENVIFDYLDFQGIKIVHFFEQRSQKIKLLGKNCEAFCCDFQSNVLFAFSNDFGSEKTKRFEIFTSKKNGDFELKKSGLVPLKGCVEFVEYSSLLEKLVIVDSITGLLCVKAIN